MLVVKDVVPYTVPIEHKAVGGDQMPPNDRALDRMADHVNDDCIGIGARRTLGLERIR